MKAAGVAGVAGLAASARNAEKQPPPSTTAAAAPGAKDEVTYKITEKDLEAMDNQAAEKASHTLSRQWTNFAFYFMASLSIILPLLFLSEFLPLSIVRGMLPFAALPTRPVRLASSIGY